MFYNQNNVCTNFFSRIKKNLREDVCTTYVSLKKKNKNNKLWNITVWRGPVCHTSSPGPGANIDNWRIFIYVGWATGYMYKGSYFVLENIVPLSAQLNIVRRPRGIVLPMPPPTHNLILVRFCEIIRHATDKTAEFFTKFTLLP